jgi:hypothetical protein
MLQEDEADNLSKSASNDLEKNTLSCHNVANASGRREADENNDALYHS